MARKLDLTARQVTALCKGAAQAGCIPIVQIGDVTIRLVPESMATAICSFQPADLDQELEEWEAAVGDRPKMPIQSLQTCLFRSDKENDRGRVETEKERSARHEKVKAKWVADLKDSDLEHREQRVMDQLLSSPSGPMHISSISLAGPVTVERLLLRGFIEVAKSATGEIETLCLTAVGRKAMAEIERRRGRRGYF